MIEINRFPELIEAIDRVGDMAKAKEIAESVARVVGARSRQMLIAYSPHKTEETHVTTGHDHDEIGDPNSWIQDVREEDDGAEVTLFNTSEHILAQIYGVAGGYMIPYSPTSVKFWIGPPLRWPVISADFRFQVRIPGFFRFPQIEHPGFEPWGGSSFVDRAIDEIEPEIEAVVHSGMYQIAYEPIEEMF